MLYILIFNSVLSFPWVWGPQNLYFEYKYFSFFRSIDSSEALELPGVVDVITAEDIPGTNGAEDDKLMAVDEVQSMPSE